VGRCHADPVLELHGKGGADMKPRESQLAAALQELAPRGYFKVGQELTRTIEDGDLELEVVVRVRRRAQADQIAVWRAAALEQGGCIKDGRPAHTHVGYGCEVHTKRKGLFGKGSDRCRGKVVAAVVVDTTFTGPRFVFVCGRHRERHGVDPSLIGAVLELPPRLLDPLRAEHARLRREREAREDALERAGLCRDCGKVEKDQSCPFHYVRAPEAARGTPPTTPDSSSNGAAGGGHKEAAGEQDTTGATS
jgi:hypothetical protein